MFHINQRRRDYTAFMQADVLAVTDGGTRAALTATRSLSERATDEVSHSNGHHTGNGQLSAANHLSNLIIHHTRALERGVSATLPPVCIIRDDDENPSLVMSRNYRVT